MILTEQTAAAIRERAARFPRKRSAILPSITLAFQQVGHLSDDIYREISGIIDVPYVEIAEAATFYTLFPKEPVGKYLIQVCHNISCALCGGDAMTDYLEQKLGIKKGQTTADKLFTLITVECLGSCSTAPMLQINDNFYENLNRAALDKLIDDLKARG